MHKQALFFTLILILASSLIMTETVISSPATIMKVDPSAVAADPDNSCEIRVAVSDVTIPLYTYQFRLIWNASLLDLQSITEEPFLKTGGVNTLFVKTINQAEGYVDVTCTRTGVDTPGITGNGNLAKLTFLVETTGDSHLNLTNTEMIKPGYKAGENQDLYRIPHEIQNGFFTTSAHDVAVTNITVSKTQVTPGEVITISVTVENQGVTSETFNVTLSYDTTKITLLNVTDLQPSTTQTLNYDWNTTGLGPGDFIIKAQASFVSFETDKTDNIRIFEKISTPRHDRAVTSITASPKQVNPGESVTVSVVVSNIGNYPESFTVALYYDSTWITNQTVTNLQPGNTQTLTFTWDTTGVPKGGYLVKAVADKQPEEPYINNNSLTLRYEDTIQIGSSETPIPYYIIAIAIGAVVAVAVIVFLLMRRRSKPAAP